MKSEIIIFYDGICILCSNAMNFIQRNDKKNSFLLSPLQSSYAQRTIDPKFIRDMDTVIVMKDGELFTKSKAAFVVLDTCGVMCHPRVERRVAERDGRKDEGDAAALCRAQG